jgi:hypothetical protein
LIVEGAGQSNVVTFQTKNHDILSKVAHKCKDRDAAGSTETNILRTAANIIRASIHATNQYPDEYPDLSDTTQSMDY